jgi:hypothetical protein
MNDPISSGRITRRAIGLLGRQMQRVVAKRVVRFVLFNYLLDFGNGSPHLLQITKQGGSLGRKRFAGHTKRTTRRDL